MKIHIQGDYDSYSMDALCDMVLHPKSVLRGFHEICHSSAWELNPRRFLTRLERWNHEQKTRHL